MHKAIITAAFLTGLAAGGAAPAGEPTAEAHLPLHEGRDAYGPAAAFGKDVFLVVWQSGRLAPGDLRKGLKFCGDIVGCRVGKDGRPLDAKPFVICGAKDLQEKPKIAFGNGVFLVVWQDLRNEKDWDVYAARVSPDGKVLDPDGILVSGDARSQAVPRVAWDGAAFQVVWQDIRSGAYAVHGARVSAGGKVLEAQGVCLAAGGSGRHPHCHSPAVGSAGNGKSLSVWVVYDGSRSCILAGGKPVAGTLGQRDKAGGSGHGPNAGASPISFAGSPTGYLGVWRTWRPVSRGNAPDKSQGALFSPKGARTKNVSIGGGRVVDPDVAWDGSAFVVAWSSYFVKGKPAGRGVKVAYDAVRCSRITPEGALAGKVIAISGAANSPASMATVASDGKGTTLVAYERHPSKKETPITIGFRMLRAK